MNLKSANKTFLKLILGVISVVFLYQLLAIHNDLPLDFIKAALKILFIALSSIVIFDVDKIFKKLGPKNLNIILNIIIGILLFLYFYIPIFNHFNYREAGLDLGIYDQAIWKYAHFLGFSNSIDGFWGLKNVLGDHFEIILMIISPIYWFYSSVIILHLFNGLVITFGCYLLYKLAKLKLNQNEILAKASVIIFLLFTGLQMAIMEGQFHPLVYVPILIIAIVYFIEIKNWWAYIIAIVLLLSIKENMGLYLVFIGIYLVAIDRKYWKIAVLTAGLGILHYLITVREVTALYGGKYRYFNYTRLGQNNWQIIKTLILKPLYAIKVFLTPIDKIQTLLLILGSFGLLVISAPLIIAIPMFAERFFSDDEHIWLFNMHYNAPLAGALICALIFFFSQTYFSPRKNRLSKILSQHLSAYSLIIFVLISTILININYRSDLFRFFYHAKNNVIIDQDSRDLNEAIKIIPPKASVAAQDGIVTHFTEREQVYELPVVKDPQFIVVNFNKSYWPMSDQELKNLINNAMANGYSIRYSKNSTLVLGKNQ